MSLCQQPGSPHAHVTVWASPASQPIRWVGRTGALEMNEKWGPMTRIVIMGGGPAGYEAALVAAQYGAEVTVVETEGAGGGCVLYDCVPSKTFIASAGARTSVRAAGELGVNVPPQKVDVDIVAVHSRVAGLALAQSADIGARLLAEGVVLVEGRAELADSAPGLAAHRVVVTASDGNE